ncbi:MAG: DUF2461 domain-containing protein [bacterium]|nr:DUF2461 domain-containing protein [bacterium]
MNGFKGFSKETVTFFENLKENNSKEWFNANKEVFEAHVMEPSVGFVIAMGERLQTIAPDIMAIPRKDKSILRIYRDTRFSKSKQPYKTRMGIIFWEGEGKKVECPGFYFHLEPSKLMMAGGLVNLPKHMMEPYREAVADPDKGKALPGILEALKEKNYKIGRSHYKRVPRGYDPDHPNKELLKYNGLYASMEEEIPDLLYSAELVDYCFQRFQEMLPLHQWLLTIDT